MSVELFTQKPQLDTALVLRLDDRGVQSINGLMETCNRIETKLDAVIEETIRMREMSTISSHFSRIEEVDDGPGKKSFIDRAIGCFKPPMCFIGGLFVSAAKGFAAFFVRSGDK